MNEILEIDTIDNDMIFCKVENLNVNVPFIYKGIKLILDLILEDKNLCVLKFKNEAQKTLVFNKLLK